MKKNSTAQPVLAMLLGAIILQLIPVSGEWLAWKPNFLLLVMIAWVLYFPDRYGIEFSVVVGICADLLFSSTLGYHVLIFTICGLIVIFFHRVIAYLHMGHRVVLVFLLVIVVELLKAMMNSLGDIPVFLKHIPYLAVISSLFWVPLDKVVNRFYLRHK